MPLKELTGAAQPDPAPATPPASWDRRRPGRPDQASPHLIPLMRTQDMDDPIIPDLWEDPPFEDALEPARGIATGLLLSVPIWTAIGWVVWAVL